MSRLTSINLSGSGINGSEAAELTAAVYYNRLQNWDMFRVAAAI